MRTAVTVSLAAHAALIVAGIVSIPAARLDLSVDVDVIPVQMIDVAEFTELTIGLDNVVPPEPEPTPPEPAPPEPEPVPEPEPAPPEPEPEAVPPEPEPVVEPEPPATEPEVAEPAEVAAAEPEVRVIEPGPAPAPEAEPAPEPVPEPEPAPEPQPAAIVPMPTPRPRPTAAPEPEPEPAEPDPEPPAPEPEAVPDPLATEIAEAREPDAIAALLNTPEPETTEPPGAAEGVDNAAMTQSEIDAFYSALARCWRLPAVWDNNPAEFTVVIRFELNIDGTVRGIPLVLQAPTGTYAQVARETALRAIFDCQPYQLPVEKYDSWRQNTVTFNPVDMFLP